LSVALGGIAPGCVYDADDRCGENQTLIENDRCACIAGYVPGVGGCVSCGENQEERSGACVCVDGYTRPGEAAACEPLPASLGAECDTADKPCSDSDYPECHVTDANVGYCTTTGCQTSADCEGEYTCQATADGSFCRRPRTRLLDKCKTDADCASGEASFCQPNEKVCLVPCSVGGTNECLDSEVCCDFSIFAAGIFCTPTAECLTQSGG